mmetsp:Transcript_9810/g.32406  ORF Transcript_9810/g.32406 Transcript_9810/m.32406 type:complete len:269 (+) Transcript_9810:1420-2226(+)
MVSTRVSGGPNLVGPGPAVGAAREGAAGGTPPGIDAPRPTPGKKPGDPCPEDDPTGVEAVVVPGTAVPATRSVSPPTGGPNPLSVRIGFPMRTPAANRSETCFGILGRPDAYREGWYMPYRAACAAAAAAAAAAVFGEPPGPTPSARPNPALACAAAAAAAATSSGTPSMPCAGAMTFPSASRRCAPTRVLPAAAAAARSSASLWSASRFSRFKIRRTSRTLLMYAAACAKSPCVSANRLPSPSTQSRTLPSRLVMTYRFACCCHMSS